MPKSPTAFLSFLTIFSMDARTLKEELEAGEVYQQEDKPTIPLGAARLLRQVLIARRNDYPTTIADDATLLLDQKVSVFRAFAAIVRLRT